MEEERKARAASGDECADSGEACAGSKAEGSSARARKIVRISQLIAPPHYGLWRDVRAGRHRE